MGLFSARTLANHMRNAYSSLEPKHPRFSLPAHNSLVPKQVLVWSRPVASIVLSQHRLSSIVYEGVRSYRDTLRLSNEPHRSYDPGQPEEQDRRNRQGRTRWNMPNSRLYPVQDSTLSSGAGKKDRRGTRSGDRQ